MIGLVSDMLADLLDPFSESVLIFVPMYDWLA